MNELSDINVIVLDKKLFDEPQYEKTLLEIIKEANKKSIPIIIRFNTDTEENDFHEVNKNKIGDKQLNLNLNTINHVITQVNSENYLKEHRITDKASPNYLLLGVEAKYPSDQGKMIVIDSKDKLEQQLTNIKKVNRKTFTFNEDEVQNLVEELKKQGEEDRKRKFSQVHIGDDSSSSEVGCCPKPQAPLYGFSVGATLFGGYKAASVFLSDANVVKTIADNVEPILDTCANFVAANSGGILDKNSARVAINVGAAIVTGLTVMIPAWLASRSDCCKENPKENIINYTGV